MIDPKKHQRGSNRAPVPPSPEILVSLGLELASLSGLIGWGPYARRVEALAEAMRGGEGVTGPEVVQLRRWANCWRVLDERLRIFYETHATTEFHRADPGAYSAVSSGLWAILESHEQLEGWQYGRIKRLWIDQFGSEPSIDIVPTTTHKRT